MSLSVNEFKNCQATNSHANPLASLTPGSSLASSKAVKCPFRALASKSAPLYFFHNSGIVNWSSKRTEGRTRERDGGSESRGRG